MRYEYTDVSRLSVATTSRNRTTSRIQLNFTGTSYGATRDYTGYFYIELDGPFACCGIRTWSHISQLGLCAEMATPEFLKQLTDLMDAHFNGGNVAFVLNSAQVTRLETVLRLMDGIGRGLQKMTFHNFNMGNNNHLYIWTWKGTQRGRSSDPLYPVEKKEKK